MRQILGGLFITAWLAVIVFWPLPSNESEETYRQSAENHQEGLYKSRLTGAGFGLLGANFFETAGGRKQWNIRSEFAELHREESYCFMKTVNADFYASETGNIIFTTSDFGRSWFKTRKVELEGNVEIRSKRGYLFTMNQLNYLGTNHEFTSENIVNMTGPDLKEPRMFIRGKGLVADINKEHFHLKQKVTSKRRLFSSEWLNITSQTGDFYTATSRAVFNGKVTSKTPDIDIQSEELELNVKDGKEFLIAKQGVRLVQKDRVAYSDAAYIAIGEDEIILDGNARIEGSENQIEGQRILLHLSNDEIEVEGAKGIIVQ